MNTATRKTTPKNRRIVVLDPSQFALYQTGNIEIQSPNGEPLEVFGTDMSRCEAELSLSRLQDQMHLVDCLLRGAQYPLELTE